MVNKKFWKKKKVLILGHTGFKGGWLSSILDKLESKLYGYSLPPKSQKGIFHQIKLKRKFIKSKFGDINDFLKLKNFIEGIQPDVIFHLAAQPIVIDSYKDPLNTFKTNVIGTVNVCNISKKLKKLRSLIIVTSDKCYLNLDKKIKFFKETDSLGGFDPYSASKACTEIVAQSYQKSFFFNTNVSSATVRAGNIIGGGDNSDFRIFSDISKHLFLKNQLILRNPHSIRPWQHVLEPLVGYIKLAEDLYKGKKDYIGAWNFGPNMNSVKSVLDLIKEVNKIKKINYKISKKTKKLYESKYLGLDITKAKKELKWKPRLSFKKSVQLTVDWYLSIEKIKKTNSQIEEYLKLI